MACPQRVQTPATQGQAGMMMMRLMGQNSAYLWRGAPSASLLMGALAVAAFLVPWGGTLFEYDRRAIGGGEVWRLLSCHWTHFSLDVLAWDLLAFVCLGIACERRSRKGFFVCVAASALIIPCAVWVVMPGLVYYRGLSGIATALFGLLTVTLLRESIRNRDRWRTACIALFALLFLLKIGYESASGSAVFAASQGEEVFPVPLAHVVGAAIGGLTALIVRPGD
jgi:rhomboid family GlyGly-CTERM serine protease